MNRPLALIGRLVTSSCLPRTGVSLPNAADAVVDDDEACRQCSNRLSPLPETIETSGSCLGSSQLKDDEMALDDNEMALEQPESESAAGSVPSGQLGTEIQAKWTLRGRSQNQLRRLCTVFTIFFGHEPPSENPGYTPDLVLYLISL